MIELIDTQADHVLGVRVTGEITSREVNLGMSFIEEKIRTQENISLYVDVSEFEGAQSGAVLSEIRQSVTQLMNLKRVRRVALLTGATSTSDGGGLEEFVPLIDLKRFTVAEREAAQAWAAERP